MKLYKHQNEPMIFCVQFNQIKYSLFKLKCMTSCQYNIITRRNFVIPVLVLIESDLQKYAWKRRWKREFGKLTKFLPNKNWSQIIDHNRIRFYDWPSQQSLSRLLVFIMQARQQHTIIVALLPTEASHQYPPLPYYAEFFYFCQYFNFIYQSISTNGVLPFLLDKFLSSFPETLVDISV